jgi:hypothetical protein
VGKPTVKLDGVPLAGNNAITWRLQTGTTPYQTTAQVHKTQWESRLRQRVGKPLDLVITDADGTQHTIRKVYILHTLPSDSPNRVTFLLSDLRWLWRRRLVTRDYNIPKRTGDRTLINPSAPVGKEVIVDKYDFKAFSLKGGERKWDALSALQDVLQEVTPNNWLIESFPLSTNTGEDSFSLQGILIRDSGDVALARILSFIPGTAVYVTVLGQVRVMSADVSSAEDHKKTLPPDNWGGDAPSLVDRSEMRPSAYNIHYQREAECLFEFEDDWSGATSAPGERTEPWLQNVIPTVDPTTTMDVWNPEKHAYDTDVDVPQGTWVEIHAWLDAMDALKPSASFPWTFDVARRHWLGGNLEAVWTGSADRGVPDDVADGDVMARVAAFKTHFRQTFRINPLYMDRIRGIRELRVAPRDPITGARAPAGVWGQATILLTKKGHLTHKRRGPTNSGEWILVDNVPEEGTNTTSVSDER